MRRCLSLLCLLLAVGIIYAQPTLIRGMVQDAETGEPLPAANLQIEGTYRGTITNNDGLFELSLDQLPAAVLVNYIGYESTRIEVKANTPLVLTIKLAPLAYELDPIVVTDEDPAISIMRKVIERKKVWRAKLKTYIAKAYSRASVSNDSGIVAISESTSDFFWDKDRSTREVMTSKRQSENVESDENFAVASFNLNFYDDDLEFIGYKVFGPTHPDALDHYDFKLVDRRQRDNKTVYDIEVKPKWILEPTLQGRISILDEDYALIDVDLRPSDNILFPPPIQKFDLSYQQQFSNFGGEFWLPIDMRVQGSAQFGIIGLTFPAFGYNRVTRFADYQVNTPLPDSLYENEKMVQTDSASVASDTLLLDSIDKIPLSAEENDAYQQIDSTETLEKAFKPSGFLARFADDDDESTKAGPGGISGKYFNINPLPWFNRVEGTHLGASFNTRKIRRNKSELDVGYSFDLEKWRFDFRNTLYLDKERRFSLFTRFLKGSKVRYQSDLYNRIIASIPSIIGDRDYFDFYQTEQFEAHAGFRLKKLRTSMNLGINLENQSSLSKNTDYALIGNDRIQRINPAIDKGQLRSLTASFSFRRFVPYGVVSQNRFDFSVEHSHPDILGSDFDFTKFTASLDLNIPTFLRRRLLPNNLNLRVAGSTFRGNLPIQRFGIVETSLGVFNPYGTLKTSNGIPYEGEKTLGFFAEHNFRTVPFELIGLRSLAERGISILVHAAAGRTWIDSDRLANLGYVPKYQDQYHQEVGVSINNIIGIFRLDYTQRIDKSGFAIG